MVAFLSRLWKVVRAPFVAVWLVWLISRNQLTTYSRDKMPDGYIAELVLFAFSFDTKIDEGSINLDLAREVLALSAANNVKSIVVQEEIYKSLCIICHNLNERLRGKEFIIVKYDDREYLNSYEVAMIGLGKIRDGFIPSNKRKVVVISHNHMVRRVMGIIEKLDHEVVGYSTVVGYDPKANQSWVRSNMAFAFREAIAYILFALKGYI